MPHKSPSHGRFDTDQAVYGVLAHCAYDRIGLFFVIFLDLQRLQRVVLRETRGLLLVGLGDVFCRRTLILRDWQLPAPLERREALRDEDRDAHRYGDTALDGKRNGNTYNG